ncbi:MAG: putative ubiquitin-RnfH superfamily antitoxin RatB of RatAB toxin-antitoxin module [Halieaceae bacterium]|jgi:putative ubiquitin-RnfH superfamily antitoxin RatB of RatAB toxin-antitoxin module
MIENETIDVEVAYAMPEKQSIIPLNVSVGTSALEAARQSGVDKQYEGVDLENAKLGIFGKAVAPGHVLSKGDRVEVYRPLTADPKEVRKARAAKAKERRAQEKES